MGRVRVGGFVLALIAGGCLSACGGDDSGILPPENAAPTITGTPPNAVQATTAYSFTPTANDPEGDALGFTISGRPSWAAFDASTGALTGTPSGSDGGTYANIIIRVSDGAHAASLPAFSIVVTAAPNRAPFISGVAAGSVRAGNPYSFAPGAGDADGDPLVFSIANKPSWATFNAGTGALTGTPSGADLGTYANIIISASDGLLSAALPVFSIVVTAQPNRAPAIFGTPPTTVQATSSYSFVPVASDADGDTLIFSITGKPSWASFDTSTGRLAGVPGSDQLGTYPNIIINVGDGVSGAALPAFSITVTAAPNRAPVISGSPATTIQATTTYLFLPAAQDPDGNPLTFSIAGKPAWAAFSNTSGMLVGTPAVADIGTYANIVISVSDGSLSAALPAFSVAVTAAPNRVPMISGTPPHTVEAAQPYAFAPAASDADGDVLIFSITGKPTWAAFNAVTGALTGTPAVADIGMYPDIVIRVSDGSLSAALPAFAITVTAVPNRAPSLLGTPPTSVQATTSYSFAPTAGDPDGDVLVFSITGKPGWATFDTATGALTGTPAEAAIGAYPNIIISVSDGVLAAALPAFAITVTPPPNRAPAISGSAPAAVQATTNYSFVPTATDADGDVLSFSITGRPSWATFNPANGALSGAPSGMQAGIYANIIISVSDGTLGASLAPFSITVTPPPNHAPVIAGAPPTSVQATTNYSFLPAASDPDGDALTFSITGKPAWATFNNATGALTGTPAEAAIGAYPNIIISVSDGTLSASLATFTIGVTAAPNRAPVISGTPPATVQATTNYSFIPTATDADGNALTFSITGKPSWASFNTATGALAGTPAEADIGTHPNIIISVSDGSLSAALPAFSLAVTAAPNRAPMISGTPPATIEAAQPYAFVPAASDADGDVLVFSITGRPAWAAFNAATGALTGTPAASDIANYPGIVIGASDGFLSTALPAFSITVTAVPNRAPVISGMPPATVQATTNYSFNPTATDADGNSLTFSITGKPSWATFNTATGALTGTPVEAAIGAYPNIIISVSDGTISASLATFTIAVTAPPNRAPVISGTPPATVQATTNYSFIPTATDADGNSLTFSIAGKPAWATFNTATGALTGTPAEAAIGSYPNIIISVSDGTLSGSLATFTIGVTAAPNRAPVISGTPPATVQATTNYSFNPTATDADGNPLTFSITGKPSWASFNTATGALTGTPSEAAIGAYPDIIISVSDGTLSASLAAFTITVTAAPNRAPVISGTPPATVQATTNYSFNPTATDADGNALTFSITGKPSWASFSTATGALAGTPAEGAIGTYPNIIISVTDGTLSASLAAFTIAVTAAPNRAPVISGTPPAAVQATTNYSFLPAASDPDGDALAYAISGKPSWATFNDTTGALAGTPAETDIGTDPNIIISVSDGSLVAALPAFTIAVTAAPNRAPVISGTPPATVQATTNYSFIPAATDADGNTLVFAISGKPSWATFSTSTGALTGTPAEAAVGAYPDIIISVSDGTISASLPAFSVIVTAAPNHPPSISGAPATTVQATTSYSFAPAASDTDGDALVFAISGKPSWATFNTSTGTLAGVPAEADIGSYPGIIISVSDGTLSVSLAAFTITVTSAPNRAPLITGTPSAAVQATTSYLFLPAASDPDGDALTFAISGKPSWATFNTATGALAGTPVEVNIGSYANIIISVSDAALGTALPAFTIEVTAAPNHAPVMAGTPPGTVQATTNYSFLPTASDPDGDTLTFAISGKPSWAAFDTSTGALTGTPAGADIGVYPNVVISGSDGVSTTALAAFSISVTAAPNHAPLISGAPTATVQATTAYSFVPVASDPDGDVLVFSITGKPSWATFSTATGALTGTPAEADAGAYPNIIIRASDGALDAVLGTFSITVSAPPNRPPLISGAAATTVQATTAYSFVPAASDPDGDALTFSITGKPSWATFNTATGELAGTPAEAAIGAYPNIAISVSDGMLSASLATFTITVATAPNRAPVISGTPSATLQATTNYSFNPTATDADGDALTFAISGKPSWATFNTSTGALTGTPAEGDIGLYPNITINVSDGTLSASLATFTITVAAAPNRAPVISGTPSATVQATTNYSFIPTATDADGNALTFAISGKPSWATFNTSTGALSGTPAEGDIGPYPNIIISVSDGTVNASLATFTITVGAAPNRAPVISGTPPATVQATTNYSFNPTATDADGNSLTFSITGKPSWASFNTSTGALTGTPAEADIGAYPGIIISVSDGTLSASLAAFTIGVTAAPNRAPVISGTPPATVQATTNYSFNPAATDADGNSLTFSITGKPSWASFNTSTGALTGTPAEADIGAYPGIIISVSDGTLNASLATFTIGVTAAPNRAPVISGTPPATVQATTNYSFIPTATDADGDALTFSITGKPAWATFNTSTGALAGTPAEAAIGAYPNIVIGVSDGTLSASLAAFTITVATAPNRAPVISGTPPATVQATTNYSFIPTVTDADGDALTFSITGKPSWATFNTSTGALTGTPAEAAIGSYPNIIINVSDGTLSASLSTFTIGVSAAPNRAPVISGTPPATVQATTHYSFNPTATDADGDALTFSITGKPSWATFNTSTGALTGTPAEAAIGSYPNIIINVSDGTLSASLSTFTIGVSAAPNRAPVISGTPPATVQATTNYSFNPTATDADGDALTFSISGKPSWATFNTSTGALTGTPAEAGIGAYSNIIISVSDGTLSASLSTFTIGVIAAPNRAPVINGTPPATVQATTNYSFIPTATDADGDALTFSITGKPAWAAFNTSTGALAGTPAEAAIGSYPNIIINVSDGTLSASLATFTIGVTAAPNRAPAISGTPPATVQATTNYSFIPTATDADGDALTFSITGKPAWAAFNTSTGALTGTPAEAAIGSYPNIIISVSDGILSASLAAFTIAVTAAPNRAPVISGTPPATVQATANYSFSPTATDADGDTLTFSITGKPVWATFNTATGALAGTPNGSQAGTYANILISVSDGALSASLAAFSVNVTAAPTHSPVISGTPPGSIAAGNTYSFIPDASDADGDVLAFSITGKPSWGIFSTATGALGGTPDGDDVGTYLNIVISVSDGTSSASLPAFSISVRPLVPADSAVLTWIGPTGNNDASELTNLAGFTIRHGLSADNLTEYIDVPDPSATSYTFTGLPSGTHYFAVAAYNVDEAASELSDVQSKIVP